VLGTESRKAWSELLALLADADARYLGKEWNIERAGDIADGHRFLMHVLHSGMEQWLEADPARPRAVRFVTPTLKLLGDNPDAIYYTAPLDPKRRYRVRGNTGGAVYTSAHDRGRQRRGPLPQARRGRTQRHAVRRQARRQLRGVARRGREGPQSARARARRGHAHHAPLLRDGEVDGRGSEPAGAALGRTARRPGSAADARTTRASPRGSGASRTTSAPRRSISRRWIPRAAAVGLARAERVQGADEVAARGGRASARSTTPTRWRPTS
jgi:hypothetical protein